MAFLTLNKNGEIEVSNEGLQLPCMIKLRKKDKTKTKSYYTRALLFIYHVYIKKHDLSFLSFRARKERVKELYLNGYDISRFDADIIVKDVVKEFKFQQYTTNELAYESIKEDFVELKNHISKIPYEINKAISQTITVEFPYGKDGAIQKQEIPIKTVVKVDNSKIRYEAMAQLKQLLILERDIRELISEEEISRKKKNYESMIDQGMFK